MMLPLKTHKAIYSFVNRAKKCVFLTYKLKEKVVEVHGAKTRLLKWQVNLLHLGPVPSSRVKLTRGLTLDLTLG